MTSNWSAEVVPPSKHFWFDDTNNNNNNNNHTRIVSPSHRRTTMALQQQQETSSNSWMEKEHTSCNSNLDPPGNDKAVVRDAERCFLQRDYQKSLRVVRDWFDENAARKSSDSQPTPLKTTIRLYPPIRIPSDTTTTTKTSTTTLITVQADLSSGKPLTTHDRLAAIGLQSWYELSKDTKLETSKLLGILNHYGASTTIENRLSWECLTTVWIPFWEANGHEREALLWTVRSLHSKESSLLEQAWLKCVCHQIPTHIHDPTLATRLLDLVTQQHHNGSTSTSTSTTSSCLDEDFVQELWKEMNDNNVGDNNIVRSDKESHDSVIRALVERLDSYLGNGYNHGGTPKTDMESICDATNETLCDAGFSKKMLQQARRWLLSQQEQEQSSIDNSKTEKRNQSTPKRNEWIRKNPLPTLIPNYFEHSPAVVNPPKYFLPKQCPAWIAATLQRVVVPIATWSKTLWLGECKIDPQLRIATKRHVQQVFLSMVLFWAGWRGRKLLAHCGTAVVKATLAPLREILEALKSEWNLKWLEFGMGFGIEFDTKRIQRSNRREGKSNFG